MWFWMTKKILYLKKNNKMTRIIFKNLLKMTEWKRKIKPIF